MMQLLVKFYGFLISQKINPKAIRKKSTPASPALRNEKGSVVGEGEGGSKDWEGGENGKGVSVGDGVDVGDKVEEGVGVGVAEGVGDTVGVGDGVGVGVGDGV